MISIRMTLAVAGTLAAGAAAAQEYDRTGWPDSFTVGTASQGGTFFTYGSGWANLVAEELGKMRRQGIVSTAYRSIALENMPELAGHS